MQRLSRRNSAIGSASRQTAYSDGLVDSEPAMRSRKSGIGAGSNPWSLVCFFFNFIFFKCLLILFF